MRTRLHSALAAIASLCLLGSAALAGGRMEPTPEELETVDVSEHLGAKLPLEAALIDEQGAPTTLGKLIGHKPVILTFNYSSCPMLCSVQLGGLVDAMEQMDWTLGEQYEVITISLDPGESAARSQETKESYLGRYERGKASSWHFVRGTEADVRDIADAVGFGYFYHPQRNEYLHPAVLMLVSPRGTVSGYLYGTRYEPDVLRDTLITAAVGEVSETLERFIHSCYHYVEPTGNGAIVAKIMRYGGLVFVFGFVGALTILGRRRANEHAGAQVHQLGSPEDHV